MKNSRRAFVKSVGAAGLLGFAPEAAHAIEPIPRRDAHMKLSLAAYSFRQYLAGKTKSMTLDDFVDLCAEYELDAVEPTSYYFPEPVTPEYLPPAPKTGVHARSRSLRHGRGQHLHASSGTTARQRDRSRKEMGRSRRRDVRSRHPYLCRNAAEGHDRGSSPEMVHRGNRRNAVNTPDSAGIILALENHGGIVSTVDQLLSIVREIKSDWFGVNLDTGNFRGPDPYADIAKAAPYAVTVQVKSEISAGGARGEADFGRIIEVLKKANYRGFVALEYEAKEDPKTAVPRHLKTLRKLIG